jgi:hypothetical protein
MTAGIGAADAAVYTGVCVENNDPLNQGRIKYCVPQLSGTASFGWALPVYPGYTAIGANIYIAFEGGDRNRPIFWPDQVPLGEYPTFAAMIAANPTATTPVGSEFYIVDHGGNVQLQNTGVTPTSAGWQYLPSGYQGSSYGNALVTLGGPGGISINQTTVLNPSTKRIYKVSADTGVYFDAPASPNVLAVGLGIYWSTTAPTSFQSAGFAYDYQVSRYQLTPDVTGVIHDWLNLSFTKTGLPVGLLYVTSFMLYINPNNTPNIHTTGNRSLVVEDVGANA